MKGQYFLIGAVILSALFFLALPLSTQVSSSVSSDFSYISENLRSEFPHAANLGLREGSPPQTLSDFTGVVRDSLKERFIDSKFLWVLTTTQAGSTTITVYTGNFLGSTQDITLDVEGNQRSFPLSDGLYSTETFLSVPQDFSLSISFQGEQKSFTWKRDKSNLYASSLIQRGQDIAKLDITG
jgi:hypothetical protein